jgi:hypothetical protein
MVPTLATATGVSSQSYQVSIEGNTEFEQSLNYLDRIFGDWSANSKSLLQRAQQNIFQA